MLRVALTGGIASGKTTVSDMFAELGVPVADADLLARKAVAIGSPGLRRVIERFGDGVIAPGGGLDRPALRDIVFKDPQARTELESIVHPEVRRLNSEMVESFRTTGADYCLIVIPLLAETKQATKYDQVIVVDVAEHVQLKRVMQRDGSSEQQANNIIASQASRSERLALADHIIDNSVENGQDQLLQAVLALHRQLTELAHTNCDTPH